MKKQLIALSTATLMIGTGAAALVAAPAQADGPERHAHGRVAGASYEIGIEKERRFEIDADLDGVPAGSTWKLYVRHEGKRIAVRTARAVRDDGRWEVDFRDVRASNTAGKDTFKVRIKQVGGPSVTRTITFNR